jgi:uridine kinase
MSTKTLDIYLEARKTLNANAHPFGVWASQENQDNYKRIWARDLAVTALASIADKNYPLLEACSTGLILLSRSANEFGQIPSNISIDDKGNIINVSFGGPVGRTDTGFWWTIATLNALEHIQNQELSDILKPQIIKIFKLADCWEFNGKHLMYLPLSSNWADEYATQGYVLYDQLLRVWALELASTCFGENIYLEKAQKIRISIKYHFLNEDIECDYPLISNEKRQHFGPFCSSFTPGEIVTTFDAWSVALLLTLNIPSLVKRNWLIEQISMLFVETNEQGIPAFWPILNAKDKAYDTLLSNYSFAFKNRPGHFHNGGIWPVVNGFVIAALESRNAFELANKLRITLEAQLIANHEEYPFPEYIGVYDNQANGIKNLSFSASGLIIAKKENSASFLSLTHNGKKEISTKSSIKSTITKLSESIGSNSTKETKIIAIAGESGCGKTVTARALSKYLTHSGKNVITLHLDDYFKLPPAKNHEKRLADFEWIGPNEVRLDLLQKHIDCIAKKQKSTLEIPRMNWTTDKEESELVSTIKCDIILIEGTYSLMLERLDIAIFMEHSYLDTLENRLFRNREPLSEFSQKVLEREHEIIKKQKLKADIIINKNYSVSKNAH